MFISYLINGAKHFRTITRHKLLVMKYCFKAGMFKQGLLHDLSKYSPTEFMTGVRYYQGDRSPNDPERREKGYSAAWLHHKGRNKHHYEYWSDYIVNEHGGGMGPVPMPKKYVAEMFCDRLAACHIYHPDTFTTSMPLEYYNRSPKHPWMHPKTRHDLKLLLTICARFGEDYALAYVRKRYLRK